LTIIDDVDHPINKRKLKAQLILQMGSSDPYTTKHAAQALHAWGWLFNGILHGANLHEANLTDVNLGFADLTNVDLRGAVLQGTDLSNAKLSEANLDGAKGVTNEQLAQAKSLEHTTLPNGEIYDPAIHNELAELRKKAGWKE